MSVDRFIRRMMTVYGEPRTDDPAGFLMEYQKALGGYSDEILERAGDEVIRTIGPFWPKPAEAVKIARNVADRIWQASARATEERKQFEMVQAAPNAPEARARVQQIMDDYLQNIERKEAESKAMKVDVSRPAFEAMQRNSPNKYLHAKPGTLSERSHLMMGSDQ